MRIAVDALLTELDEVTWRTLLRRRPTEETRLRAEVRDCLAQIRARGDQALLDFARTFDGVARPTLEVPSRRWAERLAELDPAVRDALDQAIRNIDAFHRAQIPPPLELTTQPGVVVGRRTVPLRRVGVYAPGGQASYASSVLMGVVPAKTAGVDEVIVCSPPGASGEPPAVVQAACALAGASRLFAVGGAGAIGALAFGTASIPQVDAIVGPGNRWVTEAKRQVAGDVRVDTPAGPSEVLVVADGAQDPELIAIELVAQAEHDREAKVALITPSRELVDRVREALKDAVARTPRQDIALEALASGGALLLSRSLDDALDFAERYAPEHLALYTANPRRDMDRVPSSGSVFLGSCTSVAFGDYLTGANHVLPTAGRARTSSGLSVNDFLRSFTYQELTPAGARALSGPTAELALAEGLPGHAAAARARGAPAREVP